MSEYFEYYRSGKKGFMALRTRQNYPPHFHQNIELCILLSGEQHLRVGGKEIHATAPSITVFDSYTVHSYDKGDGDYIALIIPYDMLAKFNLLRKGKVFEKIYIQDAELVNDVTNIVNKYLHNNSDDYLLSSGANLVMSIILEHCKLIDAENKGEDELINRMLTYIQNNYKENISLKSASRALGYAEGHLSRVFHKYISESFPYYVNRLRLEYVQSRLDGEQNVTKLIFDAGFRSVQTYYRTKNRE